jgi:hypothetical protein
MPVLLYIPWTACNAAGKIPNQAEEAVGDDCLAVLPALHVERHMLPPFGRASSHRSWLILVRWIAVPGCSAGV